ncbi:MAG: hypothetical protein KJ737_10600 [Proteobacteria bacterium]|nr:hypothetical protein [Pseudomonadota bacterium]
MARLSHISASIAILALMMGYASIKSQVIRMKPYENTDPYMSFNSKKILETGPDYFIIEWKDKSRKTIQLNIRPPFQKNDVVGFKVLNIKGCYELTEYHIWESREAWYVKAFLSGIPLFVVLFLFFRDFRFNFRRFIFEKKRPPHA